MLERELDGGLEIADLAAAVEARAVVAIREHLLVREQRLDRVGQLQLAAGARLELAQVIEIVGMNT